MIHKSLLSEGLSFGVLDTWEEVENWWDENPEYAEMRKTLDEPSGLGKVLLIKRHFNCPLDTRFRLVDFTGTSVKQAILKILVFYKHKTYRKEIGDHTFFEGFTEGYPYPSLHLSS